MLVGFHAVLNFIENFFGYDGRHTAGGYEFAVAVLANVSIEFVARHTGLDEETVQQLKDELDNE